MAAPHSVGCPCCEAEQPLQQSLAEVAFEKGIWGKISKGANAEYIENFIRERGTAVVNQKDDSGYTPLLYASRSGDLQLVEVLIKYGADVNALTPALQTSSLHRAAMMGHVEIVRTLLKHGAKLTMDFKGLWPSDHAKEKGFPELADVLKAAEAQAKLPQQKNDEK